MKTKLKSKVLVLFAAVLMAICCIFGISTLTKQEKAIAETTPQTNPTLTIESNNVSYADSVYILYAVSTDGFDRGQNEVKMLFWNEVQEEYVVGTEKYSVENSGAATVKGKPCLVFYSAGLAAKEMTEDIYARAYVEVDGVAYYSETMKFSVLEYVYTMRENGGLTTNQQNLFNNMLNYGASAQYQFNHNVDRIANGTYYSITIVNGKLPDGFAHGRYQNKKKIKVKADKAPKGMKFSHWEDERGIIISYDEHIEIELKGNKTYEAVYKDISSVATQLVLTAEVPYDGDVNAIDLPTAVSIDVGGEMVTLDVTWNTESFISEKVGEQTLYATLVDQSAYKKYDIEIGGIMMKVNTLPFTYAIDLDTGEYILTGYYGMDTELTLPTSYKNTFITTIASKAFNKALTLTNVVIPNTYTKIEQTAFFLCDNIASITMPFVGESANSSNSWFGWIFGASSYETQYTMLPLAIKEVTLAYGATVVPDYAFYNCAQIEIFDLSNTVTTIEDRVFYGCSKLTEFTIPDGLDDLGWNVFENSGLKRVNASSVDKIISLMSSPFGNGADLYVKGKLVTEISVPAGVTYLYSSFKNCTSIQKVILPETLIQISYEAFYQCSNLTEIVIPDSVTSIGGYAFYYCSNLTSISIPDSVTSIGNSAFSSCKALTNIHLPDSVTSIGNSAFSGCKALTNIHLPDSVTVIDRYAFDECDSLTTIDLGDGLTTIGERAFMRCEKLASITIPELVYDIGEHAFESCSSLAQVIILSKRLTSIGNYAFYDCEKLWEIYNLSDLQFTLFSEDFGYIAKYAKVIHTSLEGTAYVSVDEDGFITYSNGEENVLLSYVGKGGNIILPETINGNNYVIGKNAFWDNNTLTSVVIPNGVIAIDEYAFHSCSNLWRLTLGNSVSYIGNNAFSYCDNLTSIIIPNSVTTIEEGAFGCCYRLVEVVNKSTNITVKKGAYENGCVGTYALDVYNTNDTFTETKLSNDNGYIIYTDGEEKILVGYVGAEINLILPAYITQINQYAFYGEDYRVGSSGSDSNLVSVVIPDGVTTIGAYAFYHCFYLTSIVIPDSVTTIGAYAFAYCQCLTSVNIPDSVTKISDYTFYYCTSLTSIVIPDSITTIGTHAFAHCWDLTNIKIGNSVTYIGSYAFSSCISLTSVTIPNNVSMIEDYVFENCRNLMDIIFEDISTWYRTSNYWDWNNNKDGTEMSIIDSYTTATYFKDTYYNYYWYKL